ncbi:hypothetical protein [Sphingomonas panacis]|uniref:hypothetical protein n=1 Tax=Sphingomonas panacis TaxID=1560345 RepID=UPI0012378756|nr:hypothetical protein [Sphingomonas panacis]
MTAKDQMANTTDSACNFLESLQRFDLSMLLRHCRASIEQLETALDWFSDLEDEAIIVRAPNPIADALRSLPLQDRERIAEAILSAQQASRQHEDIRVETLEGPNATGAAALLSELLIHRAMMIDVATGGARIQDVDDYYRAREVRIRQSIPDGVAYENSTPICGRGIAIGARNCRNTRIGVSMCASYSAPRSKPLQSALRCLRNPARPQAGSGLTAHCRRRGHSLKPHPLKKISRRSAYYAAKSSYRWRRRSMILQSTKP